jgi:hypothetical protein
MNQKFRWLLYLAGALIVTSACNLFSTLTNPVEDVVSEVEALADQVDIQELEKGIEMLATELPDELGDLGNLDDLGDLGDFGDLEATVQALQEGLGSSDFPEDIPVVDEPRDDLYGTQDVVSYMTPLEFETVLSFYQEQMPVNDWEPRQDGNVISADSAVLQFEKPNRTAIVVLGINPQDGKTIVMITIQPK